MNKGLLIGLVVTRLTGCNHYFNSPYGSRWDQRNIPCNATPPNQPGCYDNVHQEGLLNRLLRKD